MARTVHLVDALPYVFRAWHTLPASLAAPDGTPTNAVRGFADMLLRLQREEQPTHVGVAFDESLVSSFRNERHPGYKASRELPPPELEAQLGACQELCRALGHPVFVDARYEADDLIATLAAPLARRGHDVVIVTNDKDLMQLVSERVLVYDFARGARYGPEGVRERLGVRPEQVVDLQALAGDSVDDIPGVRGVGAKSAAALLAECGDLDAIYADLGRVAELPLRGARALAAKLEAGRADAFLSRELATLAKDAPARAGLRELAWRGADPALLDPLLERLGMQRLRERVVRWR